MNNSTSGPDPAAALYQGISGHEYHEQKRRLHPPALDWVMAFRAGKFQPHVRPDDVVFEFGVGAGWNLARLGCARRIGTDASHFLAERVAALGIEFAAGLAAVPDATANVAICHHALEHVLEPAHVLRELSRILRPDGRLVLHVPWEREWRYSRYRAGEPNHHLYNWNAQNLGNLLMVLGYRIDFVGVRRYGYDRFAASLAARLHAGERTFKSIRACLVALRPLREIELTASQIADRGRTTITD